MKWARKSTSFIINYPTASQHNNYFSCRLYGWDLNFNQIDIDFVDLDFDLNMKTLHIRVTAREY